MKKNIILLVACLCFTTFTFCQNVSIKTNPGLLLNGNLVLGSEFALNQNSSLEAQIDLASSDFNRINDVNRKNIQLRYKRDLFDNEKNFNGIYAAGVIEAGHVKWSAFESEQTYYAGAFADLGYQFTWKKFHFDSFIGVGYVTGDEDDFMDPNCIFCGLEALQDMYFMEGVPVRLGFRIGYTL